MKAKSCKGMKAGGPTSMDRKNMGRNLSRVANQKTPTKSARGK